jgi:hypothetical protein
MTKRRAVACGLGILTLLGIYQWYWAVPVLVEIRIKPTPLVQFYQTQAIRGLVADPSWASQGLDGLRIHLDKTFGLAPGRLARANGAAARWLVVSLVGRAWLPPIGFRLARKYLAGKTDVVGVFSDPRISFGPTVAYDCGATREVREYAIKDRLADGTTIDLDEAGRDVLIAIADDGLDDVALLKDRNVRVDRGLSWPAPEERVPPERRNHGTGMAFDATIAAPGATLADLQLSVVLETRLDQLLHALPNLILKIEEGRTTGYKGIVLLNSWTMDDPNMSDGPGDYGDDPEHPVTKLYANLSAMNVDVIFAAGNTGCDASPTTGRIFGAASHASTLTVAAVDHGKNLIRTSSNGPGRATMFREKPDLSSYSGFYRYDRSSAKGTSTAAAVAAGVIAALRSTEAFRPDVVPPQALKDLLIAGADRCVIEQGTTLTLTGHHSRFGHGVIRVLSIPPPSPTAAGASDAEPDSTGTHKR